MRFFLNRSFFQDLTKIDCPNAFRGVRGVGGEPFQLDLMFFWGGKEVKSHDEGG